MIDLFAVDEFVRSLPWALGAVAAVLVAAYVVGRRVGRHSVVDAAWGLLFCAVAITSFVLSSGHGDVGRRWLLLTMTALWGVRLAAHIARRSRGRGEDPRYASMLAGRGVLGTIVVVYVTQGLLAYVVSAPVQIGSFITASPGLIAYLGVVAWLVGMLFESVGDAQLERYKADPDRGEVMDSGLWRYTRHPNYFGDACVWIGIFLVAAEHWPGMLAVVSPIIMVYLLAFGSGKRVLERRLAERPAYRRYMQRTSGVVPMPPRRAEDESTPP